MHTLRLPHAFASPRVTPIVENIPNAKLACVTNLRHG